MASEGGNTFRMDPTEMLWPCAVRVTWAGEEVVVEISGHGDDEEAQATRPIAGPWSSPPPAYRNAA
ncbi:hypothetical protein [Planosporangium mesophilum]|nr:hypothetical protein [Planosporangium mesophilum]NJC84640.1 hypothetical protein [Planosporangium mesophilum]